MKPLHALLLALPPFLLATSSLAQSELPSCPWVGPAEYLSRRGSPGDSLVIPLHPSPAKICYSRPNARGRTVMGELIPYGKLWRTGANEPTFLFLSGKAEVAGVVLNPGRYILMSVPGPDAWSLLFFTSGAEEVSAVFGDLTRVGMAALPSEPTDGHVEALTFSTVERSAGVEVLLEWERTRVRIPFVPR